MNARRYRMLILLMIAWSMVVLLWYMQEVWELTARCELIGTVEACCPKGGCKFYPASK